MTVDLSAFDTLASTQETGIDIDIKGPDRRTTLGFTIRVAGPDSDRQKAAYRDITNARLAAEDAAPMSAADIEKNIVTVLSRATISWTPNPKFGGEEKECTVDNVAAVYKAYPFILEQVRAKAENRAAFTKGSVAPSAEQ